MDFARRQYKYLWPRPGSGPLSAAYTAFWPPAVPGTMAGSVVSGPFPGTSAIQWGDVSPATFGVDIFGVPIRTFWSQAIQLDNRADWFLGKWIMPVAINSAQPIFAMQNNTGAPNLVTQILVQINADMTISIGLTGGNNVYVFKNDYALFNTAAHRGTILGTSKKKLTLGAWNHISLSMHLVPLSTPAKCKMVLYWDGCPEITTANFGLTNSGAAIAAWVWGGSDGSALASSQWVLKDSQGINNNGVVSPKERITGYFPVSDYASSWTPSTGGSCAAMVNENPGPDDDGTYMSLPSLAAPNQLFNMASIATSQNVLAVVANAALKAGASQSIGGLLKKKLTGSPVPFGSAIVGEGAYTTLQFISEVNPDTGLPWTDAQTDAAAWGVQGVAGSGERVSQFFLEKLWMDTTSYPCGGSSYAY